MQESFIRLIINVWCPFANAAAGVVVGTRCHLTINAKGFEVLLKKPRQTLKLVHVFLF